MNATETITEAHTYAVVYARGAAHIQGLGEKVFSSADSLNYSRSTCPALTKNISFWCTALRTTDLAEAVKTAIALADSGTTRGVCKKCLKTALAILHDDAQQIENERRSAPAGVIGEWIEDVPETDGRPVWTFSTDYDDCTEIYHAEVTGDGPCTWTVGECFPDGRTIETGESDTVEEAQQRAQQAFARAVNR